VQLKEKEPKAASAAVPKRKEPSSCVVQSYSLDRSACKILGAQPDKKRSKEIMDVLGMDALGVNFSQASMDDPNVLSFLSVTPSIMKEVIKTAKAVMKKKDLRIQELEYQIHVNIKKERYAECERDDLGRMMATARRATKSTMMATAGRATKSTKLTTMMLATTTVRRAAA
jgi:hypothetical protein